MGEPLDSILIWNSHQGQVSSYIVSTLETSEGGGKILLFIGEEEKTFKGVAMVGQPVDGSPLRVNKRSAQNVPYWLV